MVHWLHLWNNLLLEPADAEKENPRKEGHEWDYLSPTHHHEKFRKNFRVKEGLATSAYTF